MSQNPVLPEENTETVTPAARKARKAPESAPADSLGEEGAPEAAPAKPRRTRKPKAEAPAEAPAEGEAAPKKRTRARKAKAPAEGAPEAAPAETPAEGEVRKPARRTRKAAQAEPEAAPAEAQATEAPADAEAQPAKARKAAPRKSGAKKGGVRKIALTDTADDVKAEAAEAPAPAPAEAPVPAAAEAAPEVPAAEPAPEVLAQAEREARKSMRRTRRDGENAERPKSRQERGRKGRNAQPARTEAPELDPAQDDDSQIVHLGSAVVLDDMLPPSALREGRADDADDEAQPQERRSRKGRKPQRQAEKGNQAPEAKAEPADDLGNRAEAPASPAVQPQWADDGVVTHILPFAPFNDDVRSHRRFNSRKGRRDRDAQPLSNASPYLPAPYQQEFYGQLPFFPDANVNGNRKDKRGRKNRRDKVPAIPVDFDFNAAMLSDSVLGVALAPREEEFFPEDDGPQPVISDQPVAHPLSAADLAEEELEALDAAVNGNRIDGPVRAPAKDDRKGKKGKKGKAAKDEAEAQSTKEPKEGKDAKSVRDERRNTEKSAPVRRVLYISTVPDEQVEAVITEDSLVTEYFVEMAHQVKIRGNIYKGIINNIDTNLQAAFVNFGNGKNGFLQIDEVHPEYYLVPHDPAHGPKYPPIQKVLKVGQEVLVQVVKEPAGTKGAFLTTWISIAGRFLVLTPGQEQIGVSRKVEDAEERSRLKELLNDIQPGENMGVIIRTASEGVSKASIQQDLQLLQKLWKEIQKKAPAAKSPSLIYQEADLATRVVRDYLTEDIEEIWTDDEDTKARVEEIAGVIYPDRAELVKLHKEQRQTLWERFGLLKQLESVTSREVVLPSGGRLVFDQTEALMAIDINSGKTQGKTNFEAMVFRTNMEAAEAIARHLRLRDIGGQVVIDFIEMRDKSHCREVERTIRNAMRKDRARHDVGHMSSFGLLELVRQRTGTSAISITSEPCPHCHGTGVRRNMEWQAIQAMRDLRAKLCKTLDGNRKKNDVKADKTEPALFIYETDAELALYILNRKRDRIAALEEKYGVRIEIRLK